MNECAYWCDGIWTWKEYTITLPLFLFVIIATVQSIIFEKKFDDFLIEISKALVFGLSFAIIFILLTELAFIIILSITVLLICVLIGALIGKIILKVKKQLQGVDNDERG